MSTRYQKVSADEFARRHGWPTSAVISRIRKGIYDGVKEEDTWYVLRSVPPNEDSSVAVDAERYQPGSELVFPERQLPWKTVDGPFPWVTRVTMAAMVSLFAALLVEKIPLNALVFGLGITVFFASLLYEGLHTGTIRHRSGSSSYRETPIFFVLFVGLYLCLALMGFAIAISDLISTSGR